jgi:uncharacterized protein (DUF2147 family)
MEAEMHPIGFLAAAMLAALVPTAAHAQSPTGVWIDHTGRGAVEITECGKALCGHVVWLKEQKNAGTCRTQVIGEVQPIGGGTWDRGWIVDPDDNKRYSVELKPIGKDRLRVVGYMGTKLLSETMTWRRAPADLERCDIARPDVPAAAMVTTATPLPGARSAAKAASPGAVQAAAPPVPAAAPPARVLPAPAQESAAVAAAAAATPAIATPSERRTASRARKRSRVAAARQTRRYERPRRYAVRRGYGRSCGLYLPYVSLRYPCNVLSML